MSIQFADVVCIIVLRTELQSKYVSTVNYDVTIYYFV